MGATSDPVIVAAVGNRWLADQGFGLHVVDRLRARRLPAEVELASWECGTIAAFQQLTGRRYGRGIFITAAARGRRPGTLHTATAPPPLPPPAEIHGRIGDAVMGLVTLDTLLMVARYYQRAPQRVLTVEVEPMDETWGDRLSPAVAQLVAPAVDAIVAAMRRWPTS